MILTIAIKTIGTVNVSVNWISYEKAHNKLPVGISSKFCFVLIM